MGSFPLRRIYNWHTMNRTQTSPIQKLYNYKYKNYKYLLSWFTRINIKRSCWGTKVFGENVHPHLKLTLQDRCKQINSHLVCTLIGNDETATRTSKNPISLKGKTTTLHVHHASFEHFFAVFARLRR